MRWSVVVFGCRLGFEAVSEMANLVELSGEAGLELAQLFLRIRRDVEAHVLALVEFAGCGAGSSVVDRRRIVRCGRLGHGRGFVYDEFAAVRCIALLLLLMSFFCGKIRVRVRV